MDKTKFDQVNRDFILLINAANVIGGGIPLLNDQIGKIQSILANELPELLNERDALKTENEQLKKKVSELEAKLKKQGKGGD